MLQHWLNNPFKWELASSYQLPAIPEDDQMIEERDGRFVLHFSFVFLMIYFFLPFTLYFVFICSLLLSVLKLSGIDSAKLHKWCIKECINFTLQWTENDLPFNSEKTVMICEALSL